ncbi:MAG: PhaM family polyhydroxyalkanoate granule multifunctional regulatory protein [Burkholderiaceae bacterium]
MSDSPPAGFGKFVPGFEFLQNLATGSSQNIAQLPGLASWVAPTLDPQELEKRIRDLKAVHFWLEQNSRALEATIQALEVQKMTLATLKGMNVNLQDMADAFMPKRAEAPIGDAQRAVHPEMKPAASGDAKPEEQPAASVRAAPEKKPSPSGAALPGDPLQLWGALTQQFQQIAAGALKGVNLAAPAGNARPGAAVPAKAEEPVAGKARSKGAAAKTAAKKPSRKRADSKR